MGQLTAENIKTQIAENDRIHFPDANLLHSGDVYSQSSESNNSLYLGYFRSNEGSVWLQRLLIGFFSVISFLAKYQHEKIYATHGCVKMKPAAA